ncbi:homoserine dehydrogenase [PVC group bacterium]|nr:homoserine dehydrogenase [PVC group bacterium]
MEEIKIGLLGLGTVGKGVVKLLEQSATVIEQRLGKKIVLKKVAIKDLKKKRDVFLPEGVLTDQAEDVVNDPEISIVIELIGGTDAAKKLTLKALKNKKHVVTANKALIAEEGDVVIKTALDHKVAYMFEASVGGGIPILRSLRDGLVANRTESIYGIINGTANYILSKMSDEGIEFDQALKEAKEKGYAEADPSLDIDGIDSAHKLKILTLLGFGLKVNMNDIFVQGIRNITLSDIVYAEELGYKIKLLAIAKEIGVEIEVRVHPTLIPEDHLLAAVNDVYNAICVTGNAAGQNIFLGLGAGDMPTASAVLSDVIEIARDPTRSFHEHMPMVNTLKSVRKIDEVISKYYIRLSVVDQPGVLSGIANILGEHNISIASVIQKEHNVGDTVPLIMMTHEAKEHEVRQAMDVIDRLPVVDRKSMVIRVEMI